MATSPGFREFVIEQLSGVRDLVPRRMFGGVGFYSGETFFALIIRDTLYLKVGDANRAMFEAVGSEPFRPYADQSMTMRYWNVPLDVLEDADELTRWSKAAIAMARAGWPGGWSRRPASRRPSRSPPSPRPERRTETLSHARAHRPVVLRTGGPDPVPAPIVRPRSKLTFTYISAYAGTHNHPARPLNRRFPRMALKDLFNLTGTVALITGGARGLGRNFAECAIADGAKVVIVKFSDFMCPGCKQTWIMYKPILAKYTSQQPAQVRYVMKDFPLNSNCNVAVQTQMHPFSCDASVAYRAAVDRGKPLAQ